MKILKNGRQVPPVCGVSATATLLCLLALASPLDAQRNYDCGNEGQRACGAGDWERYNMHYWTAHACEFDLQNKDGTCVNQNRHSWPKPGGWLGWALREQLYNISKDSPIHRIPWFGTHNAFSNHRQGFPGVVYANQHYSITDLLSMGARHLELDPHYYGSGDRDAVRLCHASATEVCFIPFYGTRLFAYALQEIANWLRANPGEVVIIKLNDKNITQASHQAEMYIEINRHLGSLVYTRPHTIQRIGNIDIPIALPFTRWPTLHEIRAAGKQVLLMQHDNIASISGIWVWDAKNLVLSDNHPKSQDFYTCTASDGTTAATRPPHAWWDVAEGRSGSNLSFGTNSPSNTGLLDSPEVRRAVNCGVNIIGVDFFNALIWAPLPLAVGAPDGRLSQSIWSWMEDDFGDLGPAALAGTTRRWFSRPSSELRRLACAKKTPYADSSDERGWRLTTLAHPWNLAIGNSACATEFNTPTEQYEFAFPRNGYQNSVLAQLVGSGQQVWLGYSAAPSPMVAVQPGQHAFTRRIGDPLPSPINARFYGPAGSAVEIRPQHSWLLKPPSAVYTMPPEGFLDFSVGLSSDANQLNPGTHTSLITLRSMHGGPPGTPQFSEAQFNVSLTVKGPTTTVLTGASPVQHSDPVKLHATINPQSGNFTNAKTTFTRTSAPNPVQSSVSAPNVHGAVSVDLGVLPPGQHRFVASFQGGDYLLPSESGEITVVVLPRIAPSPSALTFTMYYGAATPPAQRVTLSGFSSGLTGVSGCNWLTLTPEPSAFLVTPNAGAASLLPGAYPCPLTFSDSLSGAGSSTTVPVTLNVRATITASPAVIDVLTSTQVESRLVNLGTLPAGVNIPFTVTSSHAWLAPVPGHVATPGTTAISVVPTGMPVGRHEATAQVQSPFADPVDIRVAMTVVGPTIINSAPSGLQLFVDGAPYTTPAQFTWLPNSSHTITSNTLQGAGDTRYRFLRWRHGGPQTQNIIAAAQGATYVAEYGEEFRLQTSVAPPNGGSITANPGSADGFYTNGANVQLTAAPAAGFHFLGWSGALSGTALNGNVSMLGPRNVSASFASTPPVKVTISSNAPGTEVTVAGRPHLLPATLDLAPGTQYRIVAPGLVQETANIRWAFQAWNVAGSNVIDFTPTVATDLTVRYQKQVKLTVTASPAGGGSATGDGWYVEGFPVDILATPAAGFLFNGFSGAFTSAANPSTYTVTAPASVVANFGPAASPALFAATTFPRSDGLQPSQRIVPITVRNIGQGLAAGARITGIANIAVVAGNGSVSLVSALPVDYGDIAPGGLATQSLLFHWPSTATRVQFTVQLRANGGAYSGATTLTLFR